MRKLALISSMLLLLPVVASAQTYENTYGGSAYGGSMYGGATYGVQPTYKQETEVNVMPRETAPAELKVEEEAGPMDFVGGAALTVGGGVVDFTDGDARDITDVGGLWEARLGIGHRYMVGAEVAYVGTAQDISVLGLDNDALLLSSAIEGVARVNIGNWTVQPFIFGGVGWANYDIINEDFNTSSISGDDNMVTVPVGGGLAGHISGFLVDGRFTYRPTFDDDLFNLSSLGVNDTATLDTWQASLRVGYEF